MKKLVKQPSQQHYEECKSEDEQRVVSFRKRVIPDLSKFSISKIDDLKGRLDKIKMENNQYDFKESIDAVLNLYDDKELHYSENIVFFVMQEIERFILKPQAGKHKEDLCVECCKKYFNDDDSLVRLVVKLLMPRLSQVKFSKRQVLKVCRFFSKML